MTQCANSCARIAIILTVTGACLAQQYSFRHYAAAEGLQNLAILSLAQDGEGFIWVGSEGGLYRYDGTRFRLMGAGEGLPCIGEVQALYVSQVGELWANTCSRLLRFDGQRFQAAAGVSEMLNRAQAMADGPNGNLVVATNSGLQELAPNGKSGSFTARPYSAAAEVKGKKARGIFRYGTQLWFGCEDQVCVEENGRVLEYGEEQGLPADSWDGVGVTADGTVWVRSPSKLYRKSPAASRFVQQTIEIAHSMYWGALTIGTDGSLMIPTDKGVAINQGGRWSLIDESRGLSTSMTSAVLLDRGGSLWIGLIGAGLARRRGSGEWESWTKAQGLASNLVWNILRDRKGALWVATSLGVTRLQDNLPRSWTPRDGLGGENVRWLGETPDGAIWAIAKPGGLTRIDPASGTVRSFGPKDGLGDALNRGLVDHLGRLWVAASAGLFRDNTPSSSRGFVKLNGPGVLERGAWSVSEDRQGIVWAIGPDGLWRFQDGQWRRYQKADGLLSENPYIAAVAPDNSLWVRHRFDAGVERVEFEGERLLRSTAITAAASNSVDVTAFHGFDALGGFWRGTAKGVSVLRTGFWGQYSTEDGMISDDCNGEAFWADSDGSVWVGTSGGLSHFRPQSGNPTGPAADPILSSLDISKQPRLVHISFSSLNYRYDQLVRFAYRLDDGLWTETSERSVSIAGVGPGRHRIEVRSRIRNGPFSEKLAVGVFAVEPFWWESWWFRSIAVLLFTALIYGGVLWRHRALEQQNAELERAVQQRTAELDAERAKVVEEKQRADAASAAKGQFLANMSHEIRTPLNGLLGLTRLLEDARDEGESHETVRLIQSSGQLLLRVINNILDFSKVEAGKMELDVAPFPLRYALEESVGLFHATASAKGLDLNLVLAPDLPNRVAGDEIRLRQVVQNLISNALKFTESGEVVVTASTIGHERSERRIQIEVRDTGIGIPPDRIAQLFSSFSQADSSISRRYGGTGLGLAISKRLVTLMGGSIDVESQPGTGTVFRFTVLLDQAPAAAGVQIGDSVRQDLSKLRVLLAEDNKVNQLVGLKLLQKLGITADLAENGEQALSAALRKTYDVILMDVQMPGLDGIAATRQIRSRLTGGCQPFICGLSAHATTDFRDLCKSAGMDDYLTKPMDFDKLQKLLIERSAQPVC